jgi:hypothetical protein
MPKKTGWHRRFEDPILLPGGGELLTLLDAGKYIHDLPKTKQQEGAWQNAIEALLLVVNQNGPSMFARIGMMQALYPRDELVINPDAKKHQWGKRKLKLKLKRDQ